MNRFIALILLMSALLVSVLGCSHKEKDDWHSGMQGNKQPLQQTEESPSAENTDVPTDSDEQMLKETDGALDTKPADEVDQNGTTEPTQAELILNQLTEDSYERLLAAGVLMGLSIEYPDFQLEELCYKEEHDLNHKMDSDGVYAFFQSGGESLCIHARPLTDTRNEKGLSDLQETNLGYATFDLVIKDASEMTGYTSLMDVDLSEQISQLYLLTIIKN